MDLGPSGTLAIQSLYREMTRPAFGPSPCPRCPISDIDVLFDHFVIHHSPFQSSNDFLTSLTAENPDLSVYVNFFKTAFVTSPQSLVARLCCIVLSLSVAYALCFNVHYELLNY